MYIFEDFEIDMLVIYHHTLSQKIVSMIVIHVCIPCRLFIDGWMHCVNNLHLYLLY